MITRPKTTIALTCALLAGGQASAITLPGNLGDLYQFLNQLPQWFKSLTDLKGMSDQLFGSINKEELLNNFLTKGMNYGLDKMGVKINASDILGNLQNWQSKIDNFKAELLGKFKDYLAAAMGQGSYDAKNGILTKGMLNPDSMQIKLDAMGSQQEALALTAQLVQDQADSAKAFEDTKGTVKETQERAVTVNENAKILTTKAMTIASTRQGVEMLVRAQAEDMMSSAYNATAITTAVSQVARQQQVTNNLLSKMAQNEIDKNTDEAIAVVQMMRMRQARAEATAKQTSDTINAAGDAMATPFKIGNANVNFKAMYN